VFICLVTKAAHLEVVSDLTTNAFLTAYKRFTARRGHFVQLYSDNGTNFVGSANKLDKDLKLSSYIREATEEVVKLIEDDGATWKFIPPHIGGIWKNYLNRMI
jgi:hypothetical protein